MLFLKDVMSIKRTLHVILLNGKKITNTRCAFATTSTVFSDPKNIKRGKTPIGKLDQQESEKTKNPDVPDPYAPFPDGKNPLTGEINGPRVQNLLVMVIGNVKEEFQTFNTLRGYFYIYAYVYKMFDNFLI
ncbi:hypothetical protein CDAR_484831 [Caerostris darwini]|uniref:Uncharacterized protein n=1 Tax=Caerostris darwini TaxID=1538125 RepID=A0AAV4S782_9ARAC|nr:hypothetical protein CDAR_484831 [Caerostris darwini]